MNNLLSLPYSSSDSDDSEAEFLAPKRKKVFRVLSNFNIFTGQEFKERFRLREEEVEYVLSIIGPSLAHNSTRNRALSPQKQLLVALHWLGNGSQYHAVSDMHGISKATVCRVIKRVVTTILEEMFQSVVRFPEEAENIALEFQRKGGFPSVTGCVDGILVVIDSPVENEGAFVDRKGNHSINAMMVSGPDTTFYYVSARWPGSVHDSRVLRNSTLSEKFETGWRPFPGAVLLGDSGYSMKNWLVTSRYSNPDDPAERRYNIAHKSTRRIVENAYGILRERFPCLNYLRVDPIYAGKIIMICATLHNIATKDDFQHFIPEDQEAPEPENEACLDNYNLGRYNELLAYFA